MANWPATLPAPLVGSLNDSLPNNVIRSAMDKGPEVVRRRTTANVQPISFTLRLTVAQRATLETFYNTDTISGSSVFVYSHPLTGVSGNARFVQPPSFSGDATTGIDASIALEIMPS